MCRYHYSQSGLLCPLLGVNLNFIFTVYYIANDNSNRYTKISMNSTVNIISITITTSTIVTKSITNSAL